jgi:sugar phosphate isomerase/epimerase
MLCYVSVATLPLQEVLPAAARAGFQCVSLSSSAYRRAIEDDGLSNADVRSLLDDNGLRLEQMEHVGDWYTPLTALGQNRFTPPYASDELLRLARELGARNVLAVHFGEPAEVTQLADAFGRLCDAAGALQLDVALEYPAMATIADFGTAWEVVRRSTRPNGGLVVDIWHHHRSGSRREDLLQVPPEQIFSIQLSDAARHAVGSFEEDIRRRTPPGGGELEVEQFIRLLDAHGVRCPLGVEALQGDIVSRGAERATTYLFQMLEDVRKRAHTAT